ncbi:hypothetical protein JTB14_032255 [Gonioctena quinquepunctata]|nr:hypothetical protein JTB14_032255 [Gonioctena quinquepunctata]
MKNDVPRMENDAIKKDKVLLSLRKENEAVKMHNELLLHINSNFEKEMSNLIDRNQELFDLLKSEENAYCQLERKLSRSATKVSIDKEIQKGGRVKPNKSSRKDGCFHVKEVLPNNCSLSHKAGYLENISTEDTVIDEAAEDKDCEKSAAEPSDNSFQVP